MKMNFTWTIAEIYSNEFVRKEDSVPLESISKKRK